MELNFDETDRNTVSIIRFVPPPDGLEEEAYSSLKKFVYAGRIGGDSIQTLQPVHVALVLEGLGVQIDDVSLGTRIVK